MSFKFLDYIAENSPSPRTNGSAGDDWRSAFDADLDMLP
jgi:hypothetical protein